MQSKKVKFTESKCPLPQDASRARLPGCFKGYTYQKPFEPHNKPPKPPPKGDALGEGRDRYYGSQ